MSQQKPLQYVVKDAEPVYVATDDDFSGPHGSSDDPRFQLRMDFIEKTKGVPAARGNWHCAYCWMEFSSKKSCQKHMGLVPNSPAYCKVLLDLDEVRRGRKLAIDLVIEQYIEAIKAGERRNARAIELGRVGQSAQSRARALEDDKIGCLGERANLVRLGLPFSVMDFYPDDLRAETRGSKPADYGDHDVKTTRKGGWHLLVRQEDDRNHVFIAASAALEDLRVIFDGWALGAEVMNSRWWGDPLHTGRPPCFWYPYGKLHPMSTLPKVKLK